MTEDEIERLERRLERERKRREEAERLAEEATRDLYRQKQRLEATNEELERLLYVAYHHLQEPVRGVVSQLQRLERALDEVPDEVREPLDLAIDASRRQRRQIQDLIRYAEATAGEPVDPEPVDLRALLEDVFSQWEEQSQPIAVDLADLPEIRVDPDEFRLAFHHLLTQSIRLADGEPRVEIEAIELPADWLVELREPGIELSQEEAEELFNLFSRGSTDDGSEEIGPSIVQAIVRRHGGEVSVDGEPTGGATFQVRLPKMGPEGARPGPDNTPTGNL